MLVIWIFRHGQTSWPFVLQEGFSRGQNGSVGQFRNLERLHLWPLSIRSWNPSICCVIITILLGVLILMSQAPSWRGQKLEGNPGKLLGLFEMSSEFWAQDITRPIPNYQNSSAARTIVNNKTYHGHGTFNLGTYTYANIEFAFFLVKFSLCNWPLAQFFNEVHRVWPWEASALRGCC